MILNKIIDFKDLFYCLSKWLSYDDWINMSILNKKFDQKIKNYKKDKLVKQQFDILFQNYNPKIINIEEHNHTYLWNHNKDFPIDDELWIEKNCHTSDIIQFYSLYFIVDEERICSTVLGYESILPKNIIQKYGLKKFESHFQFSAYVPMKLEDFDWTRINYIIIDYIWYVKIWNTLLNVDIIVYLFHYDFKNYSPSVEWITIESQKKIKDMIDFHKNRPREIDSYFYEKGEIQISVNKKGNLYGWFVA
jgi:hypothetical protein